MNESGVCGQHTTDDVGKIRCAGVERTQWLRHIVVFCEHGNVTRVLQQQ